jgi:hypothetical protein
MKAEIVALARRAVACSSWMPGMNTSEGRIQSVHTIGVNIAGDLRTRLYSWKEMGICTLDLADPGTIGCLIALWQSTPGHVFVTPCPVLAYAGALGLTDPKTIEALVSALEAATKTERGE